MEQLERVIGWRCDRCGQPADVEPVALVLTDDVLYFCEECGQEVAERVEGLLERPGLIERVRRIVHPDELRGRIFAARIRLVRWAVGLLAGPLVEQGVDPHSLIPEVRS